MQQFPTRITSIHGLSEIRRLPCLGKIRLGKKVKRNIANPGCTCGPNEGCFKCTYPMDMPYFVVPPEVAKVYGEKPTELKVKFPLNDREDIFPQAYKYYGASRGLKCRGNLKQAYRTNEKTNALEQVPCPCPLADDKCKKTGILNFILYEVSQAGVYQITTGSYHSLVDVNSGFDYARSLLGRVAMVPFILKRMPRDTFEKGKQKHDTLQLHIDFQSPEFKKQLPAPEEKLSLPPAEEVRPDLDDGPVATEEEIRKEKLQPSEWEEPEAQEEINSIVTPIKQVLVKTERDAQGNPYKKFRLATEAGYFFTCDEKLKNTALAAMKEVAFVEIDFVIDPKEGNLIKSLKKAMDERAQ